MIKFEYSVILHLMVLPNLYFKDIGLTQTSIFSPNTVFHSLHYSQESLHHVCFLQFSLISVQPLHYCISLSNLQIALVTDFPKGIFITSVLFRRSKAELIKKICHKGLLHLQKIVSQPFSANREPRTAIANLNIQK